MRLYLLGRSFHRSDGGEMPRTGGLLSRWPENIADKFDRHWIPEPNSGCSLWMGACNEFGYGVIRRDGKNVKAHRFAYEREKGPIPDGMEIDHTCRNKCCVNPDHLETVTPAENRRRENKARCFDGIVVLCAECGTEIQRKYQPYEETKCRRCIHRSAVAKYDKVNYAKNREKILQKARDKYHSKKERRC